MKTKFVVAPIMTGIVVFHALRNYIPRMGPHSGSKGGDSGMTVMRRIPITFKNDHEKIIGYMMFDDTVSDEEIVNASFNWAYYKPTKRIVEVALVPKPKTVTLTLEVDSVKKIVGSATVSEDGTVTAVITDDKLWNKLKDPGPFSMGSDV